MRAVVLTVLTCVLIAFSRVVRNDFVNWDDDELIVSNDAFRGLSLDNLRWTFTTMVGGHYHPLTWLSFALEWRLWGIDPARVHAVNLLLHVLSSVGFVFLADQLLTKVLGFRNSSDAIRRPPTPLSHLERGRESSDGRSTGWTSARAIGALVAALWFSVHPLRVESVAWAVERRDVLSAFWLVACVWCYVRMTESGTKGKRNCFFAASWVLYVLSLLSKAVGMTLPVVLFLIDYYPLRRIGRGPTAQAVTLKTCLWEKVLFAVPATAAAGFALWAQRQAGALWTLDLHPMALRMAQTFHGVLFYLGKMLWPVVLLPIYEQKPDVRALDAGYALSAAAVLAITGLAIALHKRAPGLTVAWLAYLVLLSPTLGLAQSGPQTAADRYTYLPSMAMAVVLGGAISRLWEYAGNTGRQLARIGVGVVSAVVVMALIQRTRTQVEIWRDSESLWTHTLRFAPESGVAHANLAAVKNGNGEFESARFHALAALKSLPGNYAANVALARASLGLADLETAEAHFGTALTIRPNSVREWAGLAAVYAFQGRLPHAERAYRRCVELEPREAYWPLELGGILAAQGRADEAIEWFHESIRLDPKLTLAYRRAAILHSQVRRFEAAIRLLEQGLRSNPEDREITLELAWLLSTCPERTFLDGQRALKLITTFVDKDPDWRVLEVMAAAVARVGDFDEALSAINRAIEKVEKDLKEGEVPSAGHARLLEARTAFQRKEPFHYSY